MAEKPIWQAAQDKAEAVLDVLHEQEDDFLGPTDINFICALFNLTVDVRPLNGSAGFIKRKAKSNNPEIVINANDSKKKQRFTLAHLLGHYLERYEANDNDYGFIEPPTSKVFASEYVDYHRKNPIFAPIADRLEKYQLHEFYADEFAMALLLPKSQLNNILDNGMKINEIAKYFDVRKFLVTRRIDRIRQS